MTIMSPPASANDIAKHVLEIWEARRVRTEALHLRWDYKYEYLKVKSIPFTSQNEFAVTADGRFSIDVKYGYNNHVMPFADVTTFHEREVFDGQRLVEFFQQADLEPERNESMVNLGNQPSRTTEQVSIFRPLEFAYLNFRAKNTKTLRELEKGFLSTHRREHVDGVECIVLRRELSKTSAELLWLTNDEQLLPVKFVLQTGTACPHIVTMQWKRSNNGIYVPKCWTILEVEGQENRVVSRHEFRVVEFAVNKPIPKRLFTLPRKVLSDGER